MRILGVIPARFASTRFPGKPLVDIAGTSMIQRVYEQCKKSKALTNVVIATDDDRICSHARTFTKNVQMTSEECRNGTERCAEIARIFLGEYDFIVNIQGDEPFINPAQIDELCSLFDASSDDIYTEVTVENSIELYSNNNIVKAIVDAENYAIDFYRQNPNTELPFFKHIGIYAFKPEILIKLVELPISVRETALHLEQLRWLDNGYKLKVGITAFDSRSIDTQADLSEVCLRISGVERL